MTRMQIQTVNLLVKLGRNGWMGEKTYDEDEGGDGVFTLLGR